MAHKEDPSIRELASEFDGFKELMIERDRRYEQRFEAMEQKTSLALTSSEKAVAKAEIATEKRFDSVNEFRATLSDQAANLLPRREADTKFSSYEDKLEDMKKEIAGLRESRSGTAGTGEGLKAMWGYVAGVAGFVLVLISIFMALKK
jgi:hypothetical protein